MHTELLVGVEEAGRSGPVSQLLAVGYEVIGGLLSIPVANLEDRRPRLDGAGDVLCRG